MDSPATASVAARRPVEIRDLDVILKTVERCNIACKYCYFFFGGDTSYEQHPPYISRDTLQAVANFLKVGVTDLAIPRLKINFHGGEPMMQIVTCD
jgi:uncharacterized protein